MKRRLISFLLAAVLLIGFIPVGTLNASAASELKSSEKLIELIKGFEGFSSIAKWDFGHYSIGYGTACGKNEFPGGITVEKADELLRTSITEYERYVNNFATKQGLKLSQQKFDALVSFTYNLGPSWLNSSSTLRTAVINGKTGNDFIYAIAMWCMAGNEGEKQILTSLIKRRLCEANLYLNGVYSTTVPSNYTYVLFNNGIENASSVARIQGYDSSLTDSVRITPTKAGYRFLGWYTSEKGGEWITTLTSANAGKTIYGHWQKGDGTAEGTAATYQRVTTTQVVVYDKIGGSEINRISKGTTVTIAADYIDAGGVKWGKTNGGWIDLKLTSSDKGSFGDQDLNNPIVVIVDTDGVNVRKGPGTNYAKVGKVNKGTIITLKSVYQGSNYLWGQYTDGWICLDYTNYDEAISGATSGEGAVTATGVIIKTDKLNVRNRPGTSGTTVVASYSRGDVVTITTQQKVGNATWGKTPKGWISLYYVKVTPVAPDGTVGSGGGNTDSNAGGNTGSNSGYDGKVVAKGTVIDCSSLRIRAGAGTKYDQVGSLARGTVVEIYEIVTVGSQLWGRINKGWVSLNYIKVNATISGGTTSGGTASGSGGTAPAPGTDKDETVQPPVQTEKVNKTGVIIGTNQLRVRANPGTQSKQVGTLNKGDKVVILETTKVGSATWGRTDKGWIHMYYVRLSSAEVPEGAIVRTVTTLLNIRAGAGTSYAAIGKYAKGTQVVITAQTTVGRTVWGRTDKGWISMDYVK